MRVCVGERFVRFVPFLNFTVQFNLFIGCLRVCVAVTSAHVLLHVCVLESAQKNGGYNYVEFYPSGFDAAQLSFKVIKFFYRNLTICFKVIHFLLSVSIMVYFRCLFFYDNKHTYINTKILSILSSFGDTTDRVRIRTLFLGKVSFCLVLITVIYLYLTILMKLKMKIGYSYILLHRNHFKFSRKDKIFLYISISQLIISK